MITKEQKDLIKEVKDASGTNEFLSVSDLITRINAAIEGHLLDRETMFNLIADWNDFLRNTPLSMGLFIGEGAIFEGFEEKENSGFDYPVSKLHPLTDKIKLYVYSDYKDERIIKFSVRRANIIQPLKGIDSLKALLDALERESFTGDFLFLK